MSAVYLPASHRSVEDWWCCLTIAFCIQFRYCLLLFPALLSLQKLITRKSQAILSLLDLQFPVKHMVFIKKKQNIPVSVVVETQFKIRWVGNLAIMTSHYGRNTRLIVCILVAQQELQLFVEIGLRKNLKWQNWKTFITVKRDQTTLLRSVKNSKIGCKKL